MYQEFKYLKRDVIVKPLAQINSVSDLRVEVEFGAREARRITKLRFQIEESPQQTLLQPEAIDQYTQVRAHPTFLKLREHGIGDRLALDWVVQDAARAAAVVEYVEARDRKGQVKGSTAGYIRKVFEADGAVGQTTPYQRQKAEAVQATTQADDAATWQIEREEKIADYLRVRTTRRIAMMTLDEKCAHMRQYVEETGKPRPASFNEATGEVADPIEQIAYRHWLRSLLEQEPINQQAFQLWLAKKNHSQAGSAGHASV